MEIFDLIDENGNLTGEKEERKVVHQKGLLHHASGLIIMSSDGKILSQQRSRKKEKKAGLWDMTASGHVGEGESPVGSLIREVKEEIGIDIDESDIKLLGKYWRHEKHREDFIENELDYIYILEKDVSLEEIKIQEEEVENISYIDIDKFKKMLENGEVVKREVWRDLFKLLEN